MTQRDDCIEEVLNAIGRRMSRKKVQDHFEDIEGRAEEYRRSGYSRSNAYHKATEDLLQEEAARTAIAMRNLRMDTIKARDLLAQFDTAPSARLGIEAPLVGVNTPFYDPKSRRGNQTSAAAIGLGKRVDWVGGAVVEMREAGRTDPALAGLDRQFLSRVHEDDWFREAWNLSLPDGHRLRRTPGFTGNAAAAKMAEITNRFNRLRVSELNDEGAFITDYHGYVTMMTHDPDKIRKASKAGAFRKGFTEEDRAAWANFVVDRLDIGRTFGTTNREEARQLLAKMYGGFVTGDYMKEVLPETKPLYPDIARKLSASRELHWKDADAALDYMRRFGRHGPTEGWFYQLQYSADRLGLMKLFGSRPKEGFEELLAYAMNKTMGKPEKLELEKWEQALRNRFAVVSGEAARPVSNRAAGLVNGWLSVQRMAKLGLTPFAMLVDNANIARELGRQGVGFLERHFDHLLGGYFQGAEGSAKREVAELLHTGILERLRGAAARWDTGDTGPGTLAKAEEIFFRVTGQTAMTANKRAAAEAIMAHNIGRQRDKAFGELDGGLQRLMQAFGIGEAEWALLKRAEWNEIDGRTYLTPDVADRIPDDAVADYLKARGLRMGEGTDRASGKAIAKAKEDLGLSLWSYFSERGNYAVLEVGPKERAMLYRGTQAGSNERLALQLLFQFKQFPVAMISKAWGAEIYGGEKGMGRVAGVVELVVAATFYGIVANFLNQLAKGQDPTAPWRNQPVQAVSAGFLRGGAASIYGDFLLGEWNRHGLSALASLAGPTFGQVDKVFEVWTDVTHAKVDSKAGALASKIVRDNTPFANMIYSKAAFDYLIFYRLQEWFNPGYLERMERFQKERQGTEFLLRPTRVDKIGLVPAIGEAVAGRR